MSELINTNDNRATIRWKLLTGVSAIALTVYVSSGNVAKAEEAGQPLLWIELDGQFAKQEADAETSLPPFLSASQFDALSQIGRVPPSVWDKGAKISFQPTGSDWIFSADIRYGKISRSSAENQLTAHPTTAGFKYIAYQKFTAKRSESHLILDFQAGKDVGLGSFGSEGRSVLSGGVRIAQFNSRSNTGVQSQPTNTVYAYNHFYVSFAAKRKFNGVGPSLSWDASTDLAGNKANGSITLDWGLNGSILFGRQRTQVHHQTSKFYIPSQVGTYHHRVYHPRIPVYQHSASPARSKNVTVPNLGGFAGMSWRTSNAKVSIGYRADMFFNAMDGGIDAAKKENRAFYGPYASISIGVGD